MRAHIFCAECGQPFLVWPSDLPRKKFCSRKCMYDNQRGRKAWNKGKTWPKEVIEKQRRAKQGENHPNWGKSLLQETREKISKSNRGKHSDRKGKTYEQIYGNKADKIKEKIRQGNVGKIVHPSTREKLRQANLGKKHPQSFFAKMNGRKLSKEHIKKTMRRRIPTSLEDKFIGIADHHNLPYVFVGDGSFLIENCNPDFININGKKIAIEVYARFYKNIDGRDLNEWKEKRTEIFNNYGWKLLFFDETETNEDNILRALGG